MRISILGIIFLIMFTLKLAGVGVMATASWWLVTSPLWMPVVIGVTIFALCYLFVKR